jgi:hypothetical protein
MSATNSHVQDLHGCDSLVQKCSETQENELALTYIGQRLSRGICVGQSCKLLGDGV